MNASNRYLAACIAFSFLVGGCGTDKVENKVPDELASKPVYTTEDLETFIRDSGKEARELVNDGVKARWTAFTYVTPDTRETAKLVWDKAIAQEKRAAAQVVKFDDVHASPSLRRQADILKLWAVDTSPKNEKHAERLSVVSNELAAASSRTLKCELEGECRNTSKINSLMGSSDDYDELLSLWLEAGEQYQPMRALYETKVELSNEGARDAGYADIGAIWRSYYDMPENQFSDELEKVWSQTKPLYNAMQCHIKSKLRDRFGDDKVDLNKPIEAHLFGNVEADDWSHLQQLVMPQGSNLTRNYNISEKLTEQNYDAIKIVKTAEKFYTSMGFDPLPESFWTRSQFTKPTFPEGGYASANCIAAPNDLGGDDQRLHMCIEPNEADFITAHSILEFSYYAMSYNEHQPYYFQDLAGHTASFLAMNNAMGLSLTPEYYHQLGLIDAVPDANDDVAFLMETAFKKIMNIPYYLAVEKWRWQVYEGEISPEQYNQAWWDLRAKYQDISAPVERLEHRFDPGTNRYVAHGRSLKDRLMAGTLSFQFQKALCEAIDNDLPRHRCSVYQSKLAGERMQAMFKLGQSVPWQQALSTLSGNPQGRIELDGTAMLEYFAPLKRYLDAQNKGLSCAA